MDVIPRGVLQSMQALLNSCIAMCTVHVAQMCAQVIEMQDASQGGIQPAHIGKICQEWKGGISCVLQDPGRRKSILQSCWLCGPQLKTAFEQHLCTKLCIGLSFEQGIVL